MSENRDREQERITEEREQASQFCGNPFKNCSNKGLYHWSNWRAKICQDCKDERTLETGSARHTFCVHCQTFHYGWSKIRGLIQLSVCTDPNKSETVLEQERDIKRRDDDIHNLPDEAEEEEGGD